MRGVIFSSISAGSRLKVLRIAVHQHRLRAGMHDGVNGRAEGHGGSDDFIARADAECHQRQMNGSGTTADRSRVRRVFVARELVLELFDARAQADPVAAQAFDYRGDLGFADDGSAEDQAVFARAHCGSAGNCGQIVNLHRQGLSASQRNAFHRFEPVGEMVLRL